MAFFKTATASIVDVFSASNFHKMASSGDYRGNLARNAMKMLSSGKLSAISKIYNISNNPDDYVFPVLRAVTADIPNNNGDRFTHSELTRFSPRHRCQVFETFRFDPYHVEHVASDPKAARGFLPDVYYDTSNQDDKHVLCAVALDIKKDRQLADGIISGKLTDCSMGCICEAVQCSVCHHIAYNDNDLCDCLTWHKMSKINGQLVFEDCLGTEFVELSQVSEGADPTAKLQAFLDYKNQYEMAASFSPIASILTKGESLTVARYAAKNMNTMPDALVKLIDRFY